MQVRNLQPMWQLPLRCSANVAWTNTQGTHADVWSLSLSLPFTDMPITFYYWWYTPCRTQTQLFRTHFGNLLGTQTHCLGLILRFCLGLRFNVYDSFWDFVWDSDSLFTTHFGILFGTQTDCLQLLLKFCFGFRLISGSKQISYK
jgi:hypothetical protein